MDVPPLADAGHDDALPSFPREVFAKSLPGKLAEVSQPIEEWLGHGDNRLLPEAAFVYRAWLRAGGRFKVIRKQVLEWVSANALERDAGYLLKFVAKQRVLPDDVTLKTLDWCSRFADDPDAIWRLHNLSAHVSSDLFAEALQASGPVLEPIFANPNLQGVTRLQVTTVVGNLSTLEQFASHPPSPELDALLRRWMNHPQSFEPEADHAPNHQTRPFLGRLLAAAESAAPTPELSPLIAWVERWDERTRINCKDIMKRVRSLKKKSMARRPQSP